MIKFKNYNQNNKSFFILKLILGLIFFGVLFISGALSALIPDLVLRLLAIPLLAIITIFALLMQTDKPISEQFTKKWIVITFGVMALWPTYFVLKVGSFPAIDARRIIAALSLGFIYFFIISKKNLVRDIFRLGGTNIWIGTFIVLAYTFFRFASCLVSPVPVPSFLMVVWEILYYLSFYFLGAIFFSKPVYRNYVVHVFMWLSVIVCFYAGIEWLMQKNLLVEYAPRNAEFTEFLKALNSSRLREGFFRSQSTFEHPLLLGEFASMGICFGLAGILWPSSRLHIRFLSITTFILSFSAAILSGSRSAFLSILVGIGFVFLLKLFSPNKLVSLAAKSTRKFIFLSSVISIIVLAVPLITLLAKGKTSAETSSSEGRIVMLNRGLTSIMNNPILGAGPGTSADIAGITTGVGLTLDNFYLAIAVESGSIALVLLFAFFLYPIWIVIDKVMSGGSEYNHLYAAFGGAIIITTIVHSVLYMQYNFSFAFTFVGIIMAISSQKLAKAS